MKLNKLSILLCSLVASQSYSIGISTGVSTLGYGVEFSQTIYKDLSVKFNVNSLDASIPQYTSFKFAMQNYGLLLNYNIYDGFGIDAGVYKTAGSFLQEFNYNVTVGMASVHANSRDKVVLDGVNPYIGLSYISNRSHGFFIGGNAGIIFINSLQQNWLNYGYHVGDSGYEQIGGKPDATRLLLYPAIGFKLGYNF